MVVNYLDVVAAVQALHCIFGSFIVVVPRLVVNKHSLEIVVFIVYNFNVSNQSHVQSVECFVYFTLMHALEHSWNAKNRRFVVHLGFGLAWGWLYKLLVLFLVFVLCSVFLLFIFFTTRGAVFSVLYFQLFLFLIFFAFFHFEKF